MKRFISICVVISLAAGVLGAEIPNEAIIIEPRASKSYILFAERANFLDAIAKCSSAGWDLVRVENNIEQAELEQHVLNREDITQRVWLNGMHWDGFWYATPNIKNNFRILNYTNFFPGYDPGATMSPSCLAVAPLRLMTAPPMTYKWSAQICDELNLVVCQK